MTSLTLPSSLGLSLVALLSACGGQTQANAPIQTAAVLQTVTVTVSSQAATGNPAPDCAPQNCQGLRIIDGNAEAYRVDAMRRAAQEANAPQA